MLKFKLIGQTLKRTDDFGVVADSINYLKAKFDFFDSEFGGTITAVFTPIVGGTSYEQIVIDNEVLVPHEVIKAKGFDISLYCYVNEKRITTNPVSIAVAESGFVEGETPEDPTPTVYEQLADMVEQAVDTANSVRADADSGAFDGAKGDDGYSPSASVERVTGGARVTITDKNGTTTAVVNDGAAGTTDYRELFNKPRQLYTPLSGTIDFLSIANDNVYDVTADFTLAKLRNGSVVTSIPVHAGDILSVSTYNNTDSYSMISLYCNLGLFSFRSDITDWAFGVTINADEMISFVPTKKIGSENVTTLLDGIYYADDVITLSGWVNNETLRVSKYTKIVKNGTVIIVGNSMYSDYDLSTETKIYLSPSDLVNYYTKTQVDTAMSGKVNTEQGVANADKAIVTDNNGDVTTETRPSINNVPLKGNKTSADLGLLPNFSAEHIVGTFGGKPVYEQTVQFTMTESGDPNAYALLNADVDVSLGITGSARYADGEGFIEFENISFYYSARNYLCVFLENDFGENQNEWAIASAGGNNGSYPLLITATVRYTKTTDVVAS